MITTKDIPRYCSDTPTNWLLTDDDHYCQTLEHPCCGPEERVRFKFHWSATPENESGCVAFEVYTARFPNERDKHERDCERAMEAFDDLQRVLRSLDICGFYEVDWDPKRKTLIVDFTELLPKKVVQEWLREVSNLVHMPGGWPLGHKTPEARECYLHYTLKPKAA